MPVLTRRRFIGGALAATGATLLPGRTAQGATSPHCKVLEIFLEGGMYHWPSFPHPTFAPTHSEYYDANAINWSYVSTSDAWSPYVVGTGTTSSGGVQYGPAAYPLVASGLHAHTRVIATGHNLDPHEAAQLHTLTGGRNGRARVAGLTSIVSHAWTALNGPGLYGLVVETGSGASSFPSYLASQVGQLGGQHRPVVVPVNGFSSFSYMLNRTSHDSSDAVLSAYQARYAGLLTHPTDGAVRSASWADYTASVDQLLDYADIESIVTAASPASSAGTFVSNRTRSGIHYAIDILLGTTVRAVCVVDHGVQRGYDTHNDTSTVTTTAQEGNLWNVLRALGQRQADILGGNILVIVHSEFGRIEYDADSTGTEHWPWAYATLVMGAQIGATGWAGGFKENADHQGAPYAINTSTQNFPPFTPTDIVAAAAWAAGASDPYADYLDIDLAGESAQSAADTLSAIETVVQSVLSPPLVPETDYETM